MGSNGIIKGQLHSECNSKDGCGVHLTVDNVKNIEAERDEPVITPDAFKDQKKYEIVGTPKQVASAVNVMGGGKSFAKGAKIYDEKGKHMKTINHVSSNNTVTKGDDIPSGSVIINRTNITKIKRKYKFRGNLKQIASEINTLNNNGVVVEMGGESKMVYEEGGVATVAGDRAGVVIVVDNELSPKTVLIQKPAKNRRNKKNRTGYDFPKGHIEPDEEPFEAALREMQEEVGIVLTEELQQRAEANHYIFPINDRGELFNCYVLVVTPFEYENHFSEYLISKYKIKSENLQKKEVEMALFYPLHKAPKATQIRLLPAYEGIEKTLSKTAEKKNDENVGYKEFLDLVLQCQENPKKVKEIGDRNLKSNVQFACIMLNDKSTTEGDLIAFYKMNVYNKYKFDDAGISELVMKMPPSDHKPVNQIEYMHGGELAVIQPEIKKLPPMEAIPLITEQIKFSQESGDELFDKVETMINETLERTGKKTLGKKDLEYAHAESNVDNPVLLHTAILDLYRFWVAELPSRYMERWLNNIAPKLNRSIRYDAAAPVDADTNYTEPVLPYFERILPNVKIPQAVPVDRKNLQKIMSKFVGDDDLRPVMKNVLRGHQGWDEEGEDELVATDAHRLIQLRDPKWTSLVSKKRGMYDIVYGAKDYKRIIKDFEAGKKTVSKSMRAKGDMDYHFTHLAEFTPTQTARSPYGYPNYKAVIPELDSYKAFEIDLVPIYKMIEVVFEYGLMNHTTRRFEFMIEDEDIDYNFAGFNGVFVMECIQAMLMMGETKALFYLNKYGNKKAAMFMPVDKSDRFMMLIMPIMTPMTIEGGSEVPVGYNITTGGSFTINGEYRTGKSARLFQLSKEKTEKLIKK